MRWLVAGLISLAFCVPASATYRPPIHKPHIIKPTKPKAVGGGGHFQTLQSALYLYGVCALVAHGIDTFIVHEIYKRKRNTNDEIAAFLCLPGQGDRVGLLLYRKPRELRFYTEVNRKPAGEP